MERPLKQQSVSLHVPMEGHMLLFHLNLTVNRCGGLVFDVVLKFGFKVAEDDTISIIQSAIVDGKLGELSVNVSYVVGIPPVEQRTTAAPSSTTPKSGGLFLDVTDSGIIIVRVVIVCLTSNQLFYVEYLY